MALTNWITGLGFVASCVVGEIGCLMLFAVVWFPIAGVIKQETKARNMALSYVKNNTYQIPVTDGEPINIFQRPAQDDSSEQLSVGMSMGNP